MRSTYRRLQDGKIERNLNVALYCTWRRDSYYVNSNTLHSEIAIKACWYWVIHVNVVLLIAVICTDGKIV
jgi:hypothetical protein